MTNSEQNRVFGDNLKCLIEEKYGNVSKASREMRINRSQLNRYMYEGAFPRPDVLARICEHFGVDANVMLVPLRDVPRAAARAILKDPAALLSVALAPDVRAGLQELAEGGR